MNEFTHLVGLDVHKATIDHELGRLRRVLKRLGGPGPTRCACGGGTRAASLATNASGSNTIQCVPSDHWCRKS